MGDSSIQTPLGAAHCKDDSTTTNYSEYPLEGPTGASDNREYKKEACLCFLRFTFDSSSVTVDCKVSTPWETGLMKNDAAQWTAKFHIRFQ
ncbi:hypothetical protein Tco_0866263 [Tanacetum coccineum]